MKIRSVIFAFFAMLFASYGQAGSVSFYVVAHEDDWQLFMNPNAFGDVNNPWNTKTVFIYVTAGDAGARKGNNSYYLARESGAKRSVRFLADAQSAGTTSSESTVTVNGNSIFKVVYKNTVSYFLRLPDGGNGNGYAANGYQSLLNLYGGTPITTIMGSLTAPTNATTYSSWGELAATLDQIIMLEGKGSTQIYANIPDPDVSLPDHTDHHHVGLLMQDGLAFLPCVNKVYFVHNPTGLMEFNLSTADIINEAATWGAMTTGLSEAGQPSTFDDGHKPAVGKNYFRVVSGSGACAF